MAYFRSTVDIHSEPMIAGVTRDLPKGPDPEIVGCVAEGLRKAGLPEEGCCGIVYGPLAGSTGPWRRDLVSTGISAC